MLSFMPCARKVRSAYRLRTRVDNIGDVLRERDTDRLLDIVTPSIFTDETRAITISTWW